MNRKKHSPKARSCGSGGNILCICFFLLHKNWTNWYLPEQNKHFHWKTMLLKMFFNSYEKAQKSPPKCLKPNVSKKINSYEKMPQNPSSKMPEAKKTKLWFKNNSVSKNLNTYEKRPQNRLPKCLKPKKTTPSLKKQFCFKKAYKFIWKKATEPSSKMPKAKKTNTFIEKTSLFQKNVQIHMKKGHRTVFQNAWSQKTNSLIEKNILFQKNINSYEKRPQNHLPK